MFRYLCNHTNHLPNNGFCDLQGQFTSDVRIMTPTATYILTIARFHN